MNYFLYDGTYDGFLSALFCAYLQKESSILRASRLEGPTFFDTITIPTDHKKAVRVHSGMKKLCTRLPRIAYSAWLTELEGIEDAILHTVRLGFNAQQDPLAMRYDSQVKYVLDCARKVSQETERFLQFVRFSEVSGIFVADIEPLYDILQMIGNHFHQRFGAQRLIIRDLSRRRAIVSDEHGWTLLELSEEQCQPIQVDGLFEQMWRRYFNAIANTARLNRKLQQQFIPLRFRSHLTEFQK